MKRLLLLIGFFAVVTPAFAEAASISRRDGYLLIWQAIRRPAVEVRETPFTDVPEGAPGFLEITYGKARGMIEDDDTAFYPDSPLYLDDALVWLFRTRNTEVYDPETEEGMGDVIDVEDVPELLKRYPIASLDPNTQLTEEQLMNLMRDLDQKLKEEIHEASLYSEKFQGKGTAFGEAFDMHQLTAAHRTFPANTFVKVTNIENGKSVTVRVNDRGPWVSGRDIDLSLASFLQIAERAKGKINVRFERVGDISFANVCGDERYQRRIGRDVLLNPGIPHRLKLGESINLSAEKYFVIRSVTYPDGTVTAFENWIDPEETFPFHPSVAGLYTFKIASARGSVRNLTMNVVACGQ